MMKCHEVDDGHDDHDDDSHDDEGHDDGNFADAGTTKQRCQTSVNTTIALRTRPYVSLRWPRKCFHLKTLQKCKSQISSHFHLSQIWRERMREGSWQARTSSTRDPQNGRLSLD